MALYGTQPMVAQENLSSASTEDYPAWSAELIEQLRRGENTSELESKIFDIPLSRLESALNTDSKKYSFWLNIYNAYIQIILLENPELYQDRREFFKKEQVRVAGQIVSFAKIEHGILRKSQWELGLGYIRKWFPRRFERKMRVSSRDYRIHFALNCGAADCPPVQAYHPDSLDGELEAVSSAYLNKTSTYLPEENEARVTSLFNWFRGDFGGFSGVKDILKEEGIIPTDSRVDLKFTNYDWSLKLLQFVQE
ncbi:DUF547 domain-containing protein [Robiginitalea sp. IMCC43444]|uniref:DUF547 domain-containing protein n=1 Tax=Robiginitalea sp. IMCC43444 TaxID=3459121 RepID=UPI004042A9F6